MLCAGGDKTRGGIWKPPSELGTSCLKSPLPRWSKPCNMSTSVTPLEAAWEAQQGLGRLKPGWSLGPLPSMPLNSTSSHHCLPVCLISALCLCLAPPPPSLWNCGSPVLLPANSVLTEFALNHTTGRAAMLGQGRQVMGLDHVLHHTFGLKKAPPPSVLS